MADEAVRPLPAIAAAHLFGLPDPTVLEVFAKCRAVTVLTVNRKCLVSEPSSPDWKARRHRGDAHLGRPGKREDRTADTDVVRSRRAIQSRELQVRPRMGKVILAGDAVHRKIAAVCDQVAADGSESRVPARLGPVKFVFRRTLQCR